MSKRLNDIKNWSELARQTNWSATSLAERCGVSCDTLRRHFLRHFCKLPGAWLAEQRQHQGIELLRDSSSIKETAACLGYKQQTNFTRRFKRLYGICPSKQPPETPISPRMREND